MRQVDILHCGQKRLTFGTEASAGFETGLLFVTIVELQISHTHKFSKSKFQWL